jgi:hypothetical protein
MKKLILLAIGVVALQQVAKYLNIKSLADVKSTFGDLTDLVTGQLKNLKSMALN